MPITRGEGFRDQFRNLPDDVQKAAKKQIEFLADNPFHPSLRLKRIKGSDEWWEARVNDNYRFGLKLIDGVWTLLVVGDHKAVLGK
jgi:mRNA-degrading endonuclease RelE of RelBE toxin-antitoxin system